MSETVSPISPLGPDARLRVPYSYASKPLSVEQLEAEVLPRAKEGDEEAFAQLVRATYVETFTLAQRLMGNEADASDVVQETYLRAFRALPKFRGDARFTTWLYRITVNCASTHLGRRERHRHVHLDDEMYAPDEQQATNPEARAEAWVWQEKLKKSLAVLPPRQRAVLVLHDVYDWSHDEISKELKITQTASKVRLHRGRKRLRELMYPERIDSDDVSDGETAEFQEDVQLLDGGNPGREPVSDDRTIAVSANAL